MKTYFAAMAISIGSISASIAQQLPFSSQYYTNMFTVNPAFTGADEYGSIFLSHRSQYAGVEGGPQTSYLSIDGKLKSNIGLGLVAYHDQTDILGRTSAMANYSYGLKLGTSHKLTFGVAAGVQNNVVNFDKALVVNGNDPVLFDNRQSKSVFNADAGIAYEWKALQVGVAVPQFLMKQPDYTTNTGTSIVYNNTRHYRFTARYNFIVSKEKDIIAYPLVMVRAVKGAPVQCDINAIVDYKKWGWFSVSYRNNYAVTLSMGVRYKNLTVGYAQDIVTGKVANYSRRSSEFLLSYSFGERWKEQQRINDDLNARLAQAEFDNLRQQQAIDTLMAKTEQLDQRLTADEQKMNSNRNSVDSAQTDVAELQEAIERMPFEKEKFEKDANGINSAKVENYLSEVPVKNESGFWEEGSNSEALKGYYVVVGAYGVRSNAYRKVDNCSIDGTNAKILLNKKNGLREVYIYYTTVEQEALRYQKQFADLYPNIWVMKLK